MKHLILLIIVSSIFLFTSANPPSTNMGWNESLVQKEKSSPHELKIYPNPCKTGQVTLEMDQSEISEIHVINIAGKEVLQKKTDFGVNKYQLKLKEIPKGIYFMRVKTTENKVVVKKLIVSSL
jgi:hypothetical protein